MVHGKKGLVSSLAVVAAIAVETGKILDVTIMLKSCKGCTHKWTQLELVILTVESLI